MAGAKRRPPLTALLQMFSRRTKWFNGDWRIKRPLRASGFGFAVLSLGFCITTPFLEEAVDKPTYLIGGICYSALLVIFAVGIGLLPDAVRKRVVRCLWGLQLVAIPISVAIFLMAQLRFLNIIDAVIQPSIWILITVIAVLFAFAIYGWYCHLIRNKDRTASISPR